MKPCRHLDYDGTYGPNCEIQTHPDYPEVRFWVRGKRWTRGCPPGARNVQFCRLGRRRINAIFDCYDGMMGCYDPEPESPTTNLEKCNER